jgi:hypothetical protein
MKRFVLGVLFGMLVRGPAAAYLYAKLRFLSPATTARPLPLEEFLANTGDRKNRK